MPTDRLEIVFTLLLSKRGDVAGLAPVVGGVPLIVLGNSKRGGGG